MRNHSTMCCAAFEPEATASRPASSKWPASAALTAFSPDAVKMSPAERAGRALRRASAEAPLATIAPSLAASSSPAPAARQRLQAAGLVESFCVNPLAMSPRHESRPKFDRDYGHDVFESDCTLPSVLAQSQTESL